MSEFTEQEEIEHQGQVVARVQVAWSARRAWPGDEVTIKVRTEQIKDGDAVKLTISALDGGAEVDSVADLAIDGAKLDHVYKIDWKGKPYGDKREFVVKAKISDRLESEASRPLYVELDPPVLSG